MGKSRKSILHSSSSNTFTSREKSHSNIRFSSQPSLSSQQYQNSELFPSSSSLVAKVFDSSSFKSFSLFALLSVSSNYGSISSRQSSSFIQSISFIESHLSSIEVDNSSKFPGTSSIN